MEIQLLIVKNSYFIHKTWKEMWKQKCVLSGNSHNMMQVFNNFPTSTITPMLGWIIKHFQEGKQRFYLFNIPSWAHFEKTNGRWVEIEQVFFSFYHNTCNYLLHYKIPTHGHIQALVKHILVHLFLKFPSCHTCSCNNCLPSNNMLPQGI